MTRTRFLRRLKRAVGGATLVEFGFVAPILCVTCMGLFDLGYQMYVSSVVEGSVHQAARTATVGDITEAQIETQVRDQLVIFSRDAEIGVVQQSYADFAGVGKPEKITADTAPLDEYNRGDCFEDANGNGQWDQDRGRSGLGNAEDIVDYNVTITYPRLFPVAWLDGVRLGQLWSPTVTVSQSTVLRNQPFAARSTGVTVLCLS